MNKKFKLFLCILLALLIILAGFGIWYVNDYYPADSDANALLDGTDNVSVLKMDNCLFLDGPGNESALIFYPGAKVEYIAYLPLLMDLSDDGVDCFIVEMPFNLAVLGADSADSIISDNSFGYSNWYISGHSLGGSMAASYSDSNPDKVAGLILLAAYPTDDLGNIPVLSVYGSNDKVMNKEKYEESKSLMDSNLTEYVIDGGNHAQFASYGNQSGDGVPSISAENQRKQAEMKILEFIG